MYVWFSEDMTDDKMFHHGFHKGAVILIWNKKLNDVFNSYFCKSKAELFSQYLFQLI